MFCFLRGYDHSTPIVEGKTQSALSEPNGAKYDYIAVTRGASYLFAYTYTGKPIHLRLGMLTGRKLQV